ncbi:MAG TPA: DUF4921 family protein [bacterium]|nr:DUF4921 family protein [bacterium]
MAPTLGSYTSLPDGTLRHVHPITGTEVWAVPSRALRPFVNRQTIPPKVLPRQEREDHCDFCETNYLRTPPERARLVRTAQGRFELLERLDPDSVKFSKASFRRLANLFEIVTYDYWVQNHQVTLSPTQARWKKNYLENPKGLSHVQELMRTKLALAGKPSGEIDALLLAPPEGFYDWFFGGTHEVLAAGRHFRPGADRDDQLFYSGEMTPEEHAAYLNFALEAALDIRSNNGKIRYVAIFQNWLKAAGASFDHLHKQVIGMDQWGPGVEARLQKAKGYPNIFNEALVDFSAEKDLIVAENDHGVVLSEIGHPYPTLAVYSKSRAAHPWDHSSEEIRGISDLVHACHAAAGPQVPCNEAWFYAPWGSPTRFPWHILIHWRTVTSAGFEADTQIFVNPVPPAAFKEQITSKLSDLRSRGRISNLRLGKEMTLKPSPLLYNRA